MKYGCMMRWVVRTGTSRNSRVCIPCAAICCFVSLKRWSPAETWRLGVGVSSLATPVLGNTRRNPMRNTSSGFKSATGAYGNGTSGKIGTKRAMSAAEISRWERAPSAPAQAGLNVNGEAAHRTRAARCCCSPSPEPRSAACCPPSSVATCSARPASSKRYGSATPLPPPSPPARNESNPPVYSMAQAPPAVAIASWRWHHTRWP